MGTAPHHRRAPLFARGLGPRYNSGRHGADGRDPLRCLVTMASWILLALSLTGAGPKTVVVTGKVVDEERKPVAGAEVFLSGFTTPGGWPATLGRVRTDAAGMFRLDAPADPDEPTAPGPGALWAYRPGALAASRDIRPQTFVPDLPIELVLGPPARSVFEILGPDGKPVAGATITPRVIDRDASAAPDALGALVAATTDAQGRATLSAFFPEELTTVAVRAPGLGTQQVALLEVGTGKKTITLGPVGLVKGRIVAEDPKIVARLSATVVSFSPRQPAPAVGLRTVMTDAQGRFEVAEVPQGRLGVTVNPRADFPWFGRLAAPAQVDPGKDVEVTVRLKRGVRVSGIVRERDTQKPIAGAAVSLGLDQEPVRTDAQGRYSGFVAPGRLFLSLWSAPKPYTSLLFGLPEPNVPANSDHELPPIELMRAGEVRGLVLDDAGKAVAGARVAASWDVDEGPMRQGRRVVEGRTDPRGGFAIAGAPLEGKVILTAQSRGLATDPPVPTRAAAEPGKPVTLRLTPARAIGLSGRVTTAEGKPIAGARVRLHARTRSDTGKVLDESLIDFDGLYTIRTDTTGRFRTPPTLSPEVEYAALAEADGFQPNQSPWITAKAGRFADIPLRPEPKAVSAAGREEGWQWHVRRAELLASDGKSGS